MSALTTTALSSPCKIRISDVALRAVLLDLLQDDKKNEQQHQQQYNNTETILQDGLFSEFDVANPVSSEHNNNSMQIKHCGFKTELVLNYCDVNNKTDLSIQCCSLERGLSTNCKTHLEDVDVEDSLSRVELASTVVRTEHWPGSSTSSSTWISDCHSLVRVHAPMVVAGGFLDIQSSCLGSVAADEARIQSTMMSRVLVGAKGASSSGLIVRSCCQTSFRNQRFWVFQSNNHKRTYTSMDDASLLSMAQDERQQRFAYSGCNIPLLRMMHDGVASRIRLCSTGVLNLTKSTAHDVLAANVTIFPRGCRLERIQGLCSVVVQRPPLSATTTTKPLLPITSCCAPFVGFMLPAMSSLCSAVLPSHDYLLQICNVRACDMIAFATTIQHAIIHPKTGLWRLPPEVMSMAMPNTVRQTFCQKWLAAFNSELPALFSDNAEEQVVIHKILSSNATEVVVVLASHSAIDKLTILVDPNMDVSNVSIILDKDSFVNTIEVVPYEEECAISTTTSTATCPTTRIWEARDTVMLESNEPLEDVQQRFAPVLSAFELGFFNGRFMAIQAPTTSTTTPHMPMLTVVEHPLQQQHYKPKHLPLCELTVLGSGRVLNPAVVFKDCLGRVTTFSSTTISVNHILSDNCAAEQLLLTTTESRLPRDLELLQEALRETLAASKQHLAWSESVLTGIRHQHAAPQACVICLSGVPTHAFVPCGHLIVCDACAEEKQKLSSCPLCRHDCQALMRIYC